MAREIIKRKGVFRNFSTDGSLFQIHLDDFFFPTAHRAEFLCLVGPDLKKSAEELFGKRLVEGETHVNVEFLNPKNNKDMLWATYLEPIS